ncbi:MAG TPA: NADP-dependent oxidoreductase [Acidimicrobiales bacterium]
MPKAYVFTAFGGPENEQFLDVPKPTPGPGELLVKVYAAGVNPADWKRRSGFGRYFSPDPLSAPRTMGIEASGVVESIGPSCQDFTIGDEVFALVIGAWSDFALFPVERTAHKPAEVSFVDAATLGVAAPTALDGLRQIHIGPHETLLIVGISGGVGIAAAQIARAENVAVIGTASASKRKFVEAVGAVHVDSGAGVVARIQAACPGGVDAIFDLVGGDALVEVAPLVGDRSRILTAADGETAASLGGSLVQRTLDASSLEAVAAMVASNTLNPFVISTFPFSQAREALALVESGHAMGKVVLEMM